MTEIMINNFLDKLQSHDLFTLQSRINANLLSFVYGIKDSKNSPFELKEQIVQTTPQHQLMNLVLQNRRKELKNRFTFGIDP